MFKNLYLLTGNCIAPKANREYTSYTIYAPRGQFLPAKEVTKIKLGIQIAKSKPGHQLTVSLHKKLIEKGLLANAQVVQVLS